MSNGAQLFISSLPAGAISDFVTRGCCVEKGAFFLGSECSSHQLLISGFSSFGFLLLTAPATHVSGGTQPSKPFWTPPLVASPCSAAVRYFPRNNFSVSYHGAVLECILSCGILVDGFPWNSREKFSSKPNTTVAPLSSREPPTKSEF